MRQTRHVNTFTTIKILFLMSCVTLLSACGGGASSNQAPDPTVPNLMIAYIKRPIPTDPQTQQPISGDASDPGAFNPGAHLIVKDNASLNAKEVDITQAIIGNDGDVKDPAFSPDGSKLVFALHKKNIPNSTTPEYWNIYEYDTTQPLSSTNPRPLTNDSSLQVESDDIEPQFLADGRIIFSSTRAAQTKAIIAAEGNAQFAPSTEDTSRKKYAFNLHSLAADGSDIKQLTFNMSDDLYPSVIRNIPGLQGKILFVRWEHSPNPINGRAQLNQMSLYTMNPDGSDVQLLYGEHSHNTGSNNTEVEFTQPQEMLNGNIMVLARDFTGTFDGGAPMEINVGQFTDNTTPLPSTTPSSNSAQTLVAGSKVLTTSGISSGGRFSSILPLLDGTNRALVSYSLCYVNVQVNGATQTKPCTSTSLNDPSAQESPPSYGIFVYDISNNTMLPITLPESGYYYTDVAAVRQLGSAKYIPDTFTSKDSAYGYLDIRSVYEMDGSFDWTPTSLFSTTDLNTINTAVTNYCNNGANAAYCATQADRDNLKIKYLADPANSTGDKADNPTLIQRPAMFLRIVKGVYIPVNVKNGLKIPGFAYGVSSRQFMRQIIGYAPIEPDGSVRVKVPANVPLSISIVDKDGKRIGNRHGAWLSVRPKETVTCNGCHNPSSTYPHGRMAALPNSVYQGASLAETKPNSFTDTDPNFSVTPDTGETMAEARTQTTPPSSTTANEYSADPSADIQYTDYWTDPNVRTPDTNFTYSYANVAVPTPAFGCSPWTVKCRVIIDYLTNIQGLWSRQFTDDSGNTVSCISCHAPGGVDGMSPPAADLDLRKKTLTATANFNSPFAASYLDLLASHPLENADGTLVTQTVTVNNVTTTQVVDATNPSHYMFAGSAANSSAFFDKFSTSCPGPTPHCTAGVPWLNPSDLKLLAEWLDIGAQYYNNPFNIQ